MEAEESILKIPKMKRFKNYYLSKDVVTEDGELKVNITMWEASEFLMGEGVNLPTQYQCWYTIKKDEKIKESFRREGGPKNFEWTRHLILPSNTKSSSSDYVLYNADGKPLKPKKGARLLNPIEINEDNGRKIVKVNVYDIPFELNFGYYNPLEDLDQKTGFLKNPPRKKGEYCVWFGEENKLYAVIFWAGSINCTYEPSYLRPDLYFRAARD